MFRWIRTTIRLNFREWHKDAIYKKFLLFSRFKGDSRVEKFIEVGSHLKEAENFQDDFFNLKGMIKRLDCVKTDVSHRTCHSVIYSNIK